MSEDLVVFDEGFSDEEPEEIFTANEESQENSEIIEVRYDDIDISESFFTGVQIAGVMCMFSLGVAIILKIFRQA